MRVAHMSVHSDDDEWDSPRVDHGVFDIVVPGDGLQRAEHLTDQLLKERKTYESY